MTRIYAGSTIAEVGQWRAGGALPEGTLARAVTPEVVTALEDSDGEEREYAVTQLAVADSLERLREGGGDRLVVVVAERADTEPADGPDTDPGLVRLAAALRWAEVVAILVDVDSAGPDLGSDPGVQLEDRDLAWYTPAELDDLTRSDAQRGR